MKLKKKKHPLKIYRDPFLAILPSIDVHGYTASTVYLPVSIFIDDNLKLKNYKILIIHGMGEFILKNEIKREFTKDKRVKKIYSVSDNLGCTIIELQK